MLDRLHWYAKQKNRTCMLRASCDIHQSHLALIYPLAFSNVLLVLALNFMVHIRVYQVTVNAVWHDVKWELFLLYTCDHIPSERKNTLSNMQVLLLTEIKNPTMGSYAVHGEVLQHRAWLFIRCDEPSQEKWNNKNNKLQYISTKHNEWHLKTTIIQYTKSSTESHLNWGVKNEADAVRWKSTGWSTTNWATLNLLLIPLGCIVPNLKIRGCSLFSDQSVLVGTTGLNQDWNSVLKMRNVAWGWWIEMTRGRVASKVFDN